MATTTGGYHHFLFLLIAIFSIVVLGLSAFLISHWNSLGFYPPPAESSYSYKSVIDFVLFTAVWTTLFAVALTFFIFGGAFAWLASVANSAVWLVITAVFWGVSAGLFHDVRGAGDCLHAPANSYCRQAQAVEAISWLEFALCIITLIASVHWVGSTRRNYRDPYVV